MKRKTVVVKIANVYLEEMDIASEDGDEPGLFMVVDRETQKMFADVVGTLYIETQEQYLEGEHENFRIDKQVDGSGPEIRGPRSGERNAGGRTRPTTHGKARPAGHRRRTK